MIEYTQEILEKYAKEKNYAELVNVAGKYCRQYQKIKWKTIIYTSNEYIRVIENQKEKLGVIKRIQSIRAKKDYSELPLILVNWFYNKEQISEDYLKYKKCFSINELFLTELEEYVPIQLVTGKIQVLNLNEFDSIIDEGEDEESNFFFMRCSYNTITKQLTPDPDQLDKVCLCNVPHNPDLTYIFCDTCKKWFHMDCVLLTDEEAKHIDNYICPKCQD